MLILNPNSSLENFFNQLKNNPSLLFLDYDGTLAPFQINRQAVVPYPGIRDRLECMITQSRSKLIIVSGRSIQDIIHLLNLKKLPEISGSHGMEHLSEEGVYSKKPLEPIQETGLKIAQETCLEFLNIERCEIKPASIAIHWRGASEEEQRHIKNNISKKFEEIASRHNLVIKEFDGGIEMRVKGVSKGTVVTSILEHLPPHTMIAYLGDDHTDEDAFEVLKGKGLTIRVSNKIRPTFADVQIFPPEELIEFLDRWIQATTVSKKEVK
jgi:trehalose 6-phosphate phosphatase